MSDLFIASKRVEHDKSRRMIAVLVDRPEGAYASVDPDLAGAAGVGAYDATMALLHTAVVGRRQRAGIEAVRRAGREAWEKFHGGAAS